MIRSKTNTILRTDVIFILKNQQNIRQAILPNWGSMAIFFRQNKWLFYPFIYKPINFIQKLQNSTSAKMWKCYFLICRICIFMALQNNLHNMCRLFCNAHKEKPYFSLSIPSFLNLKLIIKIQIRRK